MRAAGAMTMSRIAREVHGARFREELRTSWATAVLYRLPSIPVVWLFARIGTAPTAVSLMGLALALTLPLQALYFEPQWAGPSVALSGAVFQILDCADGTLARLTGRTSRRGGDIDFLTDMAQWGLLYLAIGILADRFLEVRWVWAGVGVCAAWVRLFARIVRDRLKKGATGEPAATPRHPAIAVVLVSGLSGLFPLLALAGGWLWLMVLFVLAYSFLDLIDALLPMLSGPP